MSHFRPAPRLGALACVTLLSASCTAQRVGLSSKRELQGPPCLTEDQFAAGCSEQLMTDPNGDGIISREEFAAIYSGGTVSSFYALPFVAQLRFVSEVCSQLERQGISKGDCLQSSRSSTVFGYALDQSRDNAVSEITDLCGSLFSDAVNTGYVRDCAANEQNDALATEPPSSSEELTSKPTVEDAVTQTDEPGGNQTIAPDQQSTITDTSGTLHVSTKAPKNETGVDSSTTGAPQMTISGEDTSLSTAFIAEDSSEKTANLPTSPIVTTDAPTLFNAAEVESTTSTTATSRPTVAVVDATMMTTTLEAEETSVSVTSPVTSDTSMTDISTAEASMAATDFPSTIMAPTNFGVQESSAATTEMPLFKVTTSSTSSSETTVTAQNDITSSPTPPVQQARCIGESDFQNTCLRSLYSDPDGDGVASQEEFADFVSRTIPCMQSDDANCTESEGGQPSFYSLPIKMQLDFVQSVCTQLSETGVADSECRQMARASAVPFGFMLDQARDASIAQPVSEFCGTMYNEAGAEGMIEACQDPPTTTAGPTSAENLSTVASATNPASTSNGVQESSAATTEMPLFEVTTDPTDSSTSSSETTVTAQHDITSSPTPPVQQARCIGESDFQNTCLRSLYSDPDGDGVASQEEFAGFVSRTIPCMQSDDANCTESEGGQPSFYSLPLKMQLDFVQSVCTQLSETGVADSECRQMARAIAVPFGFMLDQARDASIAQPVSEFCGTMYNEAGAEGMIEACQDPPTTTAGPTSAENLSTVASATNPASTSNFTTVQPDTDLPFKGTSDAPITESPSQNPTFSPTVPQCFPSKEFKAKCMTRMQSDPDGDGVASQEEFANYVSTSLSCLGSEDSGCEEGMESKPFHALPIKMQLNFVSGVCSQLEDRGVTAGDCRQMSRSTGAPFGFMLDQTREATDNEVFNTFCGSLYNNAAEEGYIEGCEVLSTPPPSVTPTGSLATADPTAEPTYAPTESPTSAPTQPPAKCLTSANFSQVCRANLYNDPDGDGVASQEEFATFVTATLPCITSGTEDCSKIQRKAEAGGESSISQFYSLPVMLQLNFVNSTCTQYQKRGITGSDCRQMSRSSNGVFGLLLNEGRDSEGGSVLNSFCEEIYTDVATDGYIEECEMESTPSPTSGPPGTDEPTTGPTQLPTSTPTFKPTTTPTPLPTSSPTRKPSSGIRGSVPVEEPSTSTGGSTRSALFAGIGIAVAILIAIVLVVLGKRHLARRNPDGGAYPTADEDGDVVDVDSMEEALSNVMSSEDGSAPSGDLS